MAILLPLGAFGQITPAIHDDSYGYRLPSPQDCPVWWCEATYKVGRDRALPVATNNTVRISAARHEYEPFQVILRPEISLTNISVTVSDLVASETAGLSRISSTNIEVALVDYVPVVLRSDAWGTEGLHPDPLIPLTEPFSAGAGSNQPLWFTVYVPNDTPSGHYQGTITIQATTNFSIPIQLRVFDFALPETTHTKTAYFVEVNPVWHNVSTLAEQRLVWDLYMENFRKHRVSPYSAHLYSPVKWQLVNGQFVIDFTDFDAAMTRYLDEFGFNGFNLFGHKSPLFPKSLGGHAAFTPGYRVLFAEFMKPILAHLREKGWMEKAFCYWADEPGPDTFPHVLEGMDTLRENAPGLRRLLTWFVSPASQFDPLLDEAVDVWVPITFMYMSIRDRLDRRRAAGAETWWYVAMGPSAPSPNNFIDNPALNNRIRFWMAEKFGVSGDLYWAVNYWWGRDPWTSTQAFPWIPLPANGDGVMLYPPTRTPPAEPVLTGPINSLRWELVRESLEDAEYFWLLRQGITNAQMRLGPEHPAVIEGFAAHQNAMNLITNMTQYARDPRHLYTARQRIAEAIETLDNGAPMIVSEPKSRAAGLGETVVLRIEALGWPLPAFQWQFNGSDVPNASGNTLTLEDFNPALVGGYRVVISNSVGVATSMVAQVKGYWSEFPSVVSQPQDVVQYAGETAIFSVTAVSANPMSYTWLFNGGRPGAVTSTNATLLLTNLSFNQAGDYSVVLSNAAGVVTSAVVHLSVLAVPGENMILVPTGAVWRYQDSGRDPGTNWREPDFGDAAWLAGAAPLGFGSTNEVTTLNHVTDEGDVLTTAYFRHFFEVAPDFQALSLQGRLLGEDGAVVYLNGTEIFRNNLRDGPISHATSALTRVEAENKSQFLNFSAPPQVIRTGSNVLAVEVHTFAETTDATAGPVARWSFDETSSPWLDSAGTNHFYAFGTNIVAWPGRLAGCVSNSHFASDYLFAPDAPELSYSRPFTVGGWFALGGYPYLEINCLLKEGEFRLYYSGTTTNRYRFEVNGSQVQDSTIGTSNGQWRFVVGWFDGSNVNIQVDNGIIHSAPASAPLATTNPLIALKKQGDGGGMAADEVFFFKRVLTPSERTALYRENSIGSGSNALSFDLEFSSTWGQLPQFLSTAEGLVRGVGESAAFRLHAASATPLTYQWHFNSTPLLGATNSLLFLDNLAPAHAGEYRLLASNSAGSVLSQPISLTVTLPSLQGRWALDHTGFRLEIPASSLACKVVASTNLADWTELLNLPANGGPAVFVDTNAPHLPYRFYQLRLE